MVVSFQNDCDCIHNAKLPSDTQSLRPLGLPLILKGPSNPSAIITTDIDQLIHSHFQISVKTKLELGKRCSREIASTGLSAAQCLLRGGKILICGGASYTRYIAAQFMGGFRQERRSFPFVALITPRAVAAAAGKNSGYTQVFSRQIEGLGKRGDILFCISASGNSPGVLNAALVAREMGILTVGLTGEHGGKLASAVDIAIAAPSQVAAQIREWHITAALMVCEILEELLDQAEAGATPKPVGNGKIRRLAELAAMRKAWRLHSQTVVWTNGVFDLLHNGHVRNLQSAKKEGGILIVGVNSDRSVKSIKGPERPIQNENCRAEMVAALECVDYVTIFDESTPVAALEAIQPDVHCKGADYANNAKPIPERDTVEKHGGRIHFLEMLPNFSTTALIERIRSERQASS